MKFTMIVEPIPGIGYRATGASGLAIGLCADGDTERDAEHKLSLQVTSRLAAGAILASDDDSEKHHAIMETAGWLNAHPLHDAFLQVMRENRRRSDEADAAQLAEEEAREVEGHRELVEEELGVATP